MEVPEVRWPTRYKPGSPPVHVRNEITIKAPPEKVWPWLIRARLWPCWYKNSSKVRYLNSTAMDLADGTRFRWKTFGVGIESEVQEFMLNERIAWDAHGLGVDAYHAWVLTPRPAGCHVLTEEAQQGWGARLQKQVLPNRMYNQHQLWLERLRQNAED